MMMPSAPARRLAQRWFNTLAHTRAKYTTKGSAEQTVAVRSRGFLKKQPIKRAYARKNLWYAS